MSSSSTLAPGLPDPRDGEVVVPARLGHETRRDGRAPVLPRLDVQYPAATARQEEGAGGLARRETSTGPPAEDEPQGGGVRRAPHPAIRGLLSLAGRSSKLSGFPRDNLAWVLGLPNRPDMWRVLKEADLNRFAARPSVLSNAARGRDVGDAGRLAMLLSEPEARAPRGLLPADPPRL